MTEAPRCTAVSSRTGEPCRRSPIKGGTVCATHGGRSPNAKAAAALRRREDKARRYVARQAVEPVDDPVEWLMWSAGQARAWHEFCLAQLDELRALVYTDDKGVEDVKAIVAMFERSLDRSVATAAKMVQLDLTAESLQLAATRPDREVAGQVARLLSWLGLSEQQQARLPEGIELLMRGDL